MSPHSAAAANPAPVSPATLDGTSRPETAGVLLVLVGGVAALVQLVLPWFSTGKESTSGWGQYYSVAHHGVGEMIAAYAIVVSALSGIAMVWASIRLLARRDSYRGEFLLATIGALVAIVCGALALVFTPTPGIQTLTFGWYLFLLAGLFGILGTAIAAGRITLPAGLVLAGGAAGLAQLVTPWLATANSAVTGWQQYYRTAHHGAADIVAAYAIVIAAVAGAVMLVTGIVLASGRTHGRAIGRLALVASLVAVLCATWWIVTGRTAGGGTMTFGWYLFLLSGVVGSLGAVQSGAGSRTLEPASTLLLIGGALGLAQIGLPWFDDKTAWQFYYGTAHHSWTDIVSAYAILIGLIGAAILLAAGIAMVVTPSARVRIATAARIAAIVMLACAVWWIILGPETFATTIGAGGFGWYAFVLAGLFGLTGAAIPLAGPKLTFDKASFMVVFLGVPLLIFLVFVVSPFVQAIYYSMTDWGGFSATMNFIGLDNYKRLMTDDTFRKALLNNVKLGIVVPLVTIVLAIAVASMVTVGGPSRGPVRGLRASSFYRVVSFFPYTVPAIVIGLIWAQVYDPTNGILNGFLTGIGLDGFTNFGWLGDITSALPASMFVIIWSFVGFYAVLFIAAIKGVSAEVYEAAKLDGAGRFRTAVSVTIPLIRDTIQTAYIYIGIASLDAFVYMAALNPTGGTLNSTLVMSQDLFNTAFRKSQFGYATSMGVILAIVTLLFATLVFAVNRWTGGGSGRSRKRGSGATTSIAVAAQPVSTLQAG